MKKEPQKIKKKLNEFYNSIIIINILNKVAKVSKD